MKRDVFLLRFDQGLVLPANQQVFFRIYLFIVDDKYGLTVFFLGDHEIIIGRDTMDTHIEYVERLIIQEAHITGVAVFLGEP